MSTEAKGQGSFEKEEKQKSDKVLGQLDSVNNEGEIKEQKEVKDSIQNQEKVDSSQISHEVVKINENNNDKSVLNNSSNPSEQISATSNRKNSKSTNSSLGSFMSDIFKKSNNSSNNINQQKNNQPDLEAIQRKASQKKEAFEDKQVMLQSAQNRKTNVFDRLRTWDTERLAALNIQRSVLESILGNVDYRGQMSQENIQAISQLLREVVKHIKASVYAGKTNISELKIYGELYDKIQEGVLAFEEEKKTKQSFVDVFASRVEKEIFDMIINPECESFGITLTALRSNLIEYRRELSELHNKAAKKSLKLKNLYAINNNTTKRASKDFQKAVYSFLRAAEQLRERQIGFSEAVIELWNRLMQLEIRRGKALKQALAHFSALHSQFIVNQNVPTIYSSKVDGFLQSQEFTSEHVMQALLPNAILLTEDKLYLAKLLGKEMQKEQEKVDDLKVQSVEGKKEKLHDEKESLSKEKQENQIKDVDNTEKQQVPAEQEQVQDIKTEKDSNNEQKEQKEGEEKVPNSEPALPINRSQEAQNFSEELYNVPEINVELTIEEVASVIREPRYSPFDDTGLALKKVQVLREFPKNTFKDSTVIITPDCFLLCYDDQEKITDQKTASEQDEKNANNEINKSNDLIKLFCRKPDLQMQIKNISLVKSDLALQIKSNQKISLISLLRPQNTCDIFFSSADRLDEFAQVLASLNENNL